jgi:hypothetical protein
MRRTFNEFLEGEFPWSFTAPRKEPPPKPTPPPKKYDVYKDWGKLGETNDPKQWVLDNTDWTEIDFENETVEFTDEGDESWTLYHYKDSGELLKFLPEGY